MKRLKIFLAMLIMVAGLQMPARINSSSPVIEPLILANSMALGFAAIMSLFEVHKLGTNILDRLVIPFIRKHIFKQEHMFDQLKREMGSYYGEHNTDKAFFMAYNKHFTLSEVNQKMDSIDHSFLNVFSANIRAKLEPLFVAYEKSLDRLFETPKWAINKTTGEYVLDANGTMLWSVQYLLMADEANRCRKELLAGIAQAESKVIKAPEILQYIAPVISLGLVAGVAFVEYKLFGSVIAKELAQLNTK